MSTSVLRTMRSLDASLALVLAYALDHAFGELPGSWHPVVWMGKAIAVGGDWALRAGKVGQLVRVAVFALVLPTMCAAVAYAAVQAVDPRSPAAFLGTVLLLKPMFAVRALRDAAFALRDALARGDLARARLALEPVQPIRRRSRRGGMMGYHGKLEYAGKAGARLDDLLNLIPARITAGLLRAEHITVAWRIASLASLLALVLAATTAALVRP